MGSVKTVIKRLMGVPPTNGKPHFATKKRETEENNTLTQEQEKHIKQLIQDCPIEKATKPVTENLVARIANLSLRFGITFSGHIDNDTAKLKPGKDIALAYAVMLAEFPEFWVTRNNDLIFLNRKLDQIA